VPLINPFDPSDNPEPVNDPVLILNASGGVPPVADSCCEYGEPEASEGKGDTGVQHTGAAFTVIDGVIDALFEPPSVTLIVDENVPVAAAVPLIKPVDELIESPAGRLPADQVSVFEPHPDAVID